MSKDNGGAAFPVTASEYGGNGTEYGMTLRDYFAAKFLCGRAAVPGSVDPAIDAEFAYRVADAMLAERAK
jgi:hypothetical protein